MTHKHNDLEHNLQQARDKRLANITTRDAILAALALAFTIPLVRALAAALTFTAFITAIHLLNQYLG